MSSTKKEAPRVDRGSNQAAAPALADAEQSPLQAAVLQRKIQRRLQRKTAAAAPQQDAGMEGMGTATPKTRVKLRATPAGQAIGSLEAGATVKVMMKQTVSGAAIGNGEWLQVELDGGARAWITAQPEYVTFTDAKSAPPASDKPTPASSGGGGPHEPSLLERAQNVVSDAGNAVGGALSGIASGLSSLWSKTLDGVDQLLDGDSGKGGNEAATDKKPADTKGAEKSGGGSDAKKDTKVTRGDGTHTAILDPKAYLRTDPPELKSTGNVIPLGTIVDVVEEQVVKGKAYVKVKTAGEGAVLGWTSKSNLGSDKEADADLQPDAQIDLSKLSGLDLKMAAIHNMKGKFLAEKAAALGCDAASLGAVLQIESAGHGFASDGRMIIRFENHVFNNQWGKANKATFDKHFKFNADKSWTGHYWRRGEADEWIACHGSQDSEWQVLTFARSLDDEGALKSASYGAGQVMGFNYSSAGYKSVTDMFDQMGGALRPQLDGMFGFISNNATCIAGLKSKDYVKFATGYNGSGKAAEYGAAIQGAAEAYESVVKSAKPKENNS